MKIDDTKSFAIFLLSFNEYNDLSKYTQKELNHIADGEKKIGADWLTSLWAI